MSSAGAPTSGARRREEQAVSRPPSKAVTAAVSEKNDFNLNLMNISNFKVDGHVLPLLSPGSQSLRAGGCFIFIKLILGAGGRRAAGGRGSSPLYI
jgi:hypothetical protein